MLLSTFYCPLFHCCCPTICCPLATLSATLTFLLLHINHLTGFLLNPLIHYLFLAFLFFTFYPLFYDNLLSVMISVFFLYYILQSICLQFLIIRYFFTYVLVTHPLISVLLLYSQSLHLLSPFIPFVILILLSHHLCPHCLFSFSAFFNN